MKISLCLPYMKAALDRDTLQRWCAAADAGPFASLSCGERVVDYSHDMRVLLSAAAALTERVRIVPSLYVLPMHAELRVAKEIATLDVLSGGRVTVTVGVGGREQDYRALGVPFARRHQRLDQQVAAMRALWRGEPWEGHVIGPAPVQEGGPPLWAGAMMPKSMARASRWADGVYVFSMNGEAREIQAMLELAAEAWREAGRAAAPQRVGGFWYSLAPKDAQDKLRRYAYDYMRIAGEDLARDVARGMTRSTPQAVRDAIGAIEQTGCEELFLVPATAELAEVERLAQLVA